MTMRIVTANRLDDGAVVYLGTDDRWTETVECARVADDGASLQTLLAAALKAEADGLVVTPYDIPVSVEGGVIRAAHPADVTRATDPPTRPDLGHQAGIRSAAA